jgi:hypothetical protein
MTLAKSRSGNTSKDMPPVQLGLCDSDQRSILEREALV